MKAEIKENLLEEFNIKEMIKKGIHLGHHISKLHPKMEDFVLGIRSNTHIINLKKTISYLTKTLLFIENLIKEGKIILFVSTKPPFRKLVEETAKECGFPYVTERWLGGTLTNFEVIIEGAKNYKKLLADYQKGVFDNYTKKEKAKIMRELEKKRAKFEGIKDLEKLPDAIFVIDPKKESVAISEAKRVGVKIIAIVDTNCDPTLIDYPIPANDDSLSSVEYIIDKVKKVILKQKSLVKKEEKENENQS